MYAQRPAGHVPEECEAKHQQANSYVRGIRPSLPENWRHADMSGLISQAFLSRHLSEMMDRIAQGPEDVKKSVRAADELP